jgi:hypothetical protein
MVFDVTAEAISAPPAPRFRFAAGVPSGDLSVVRARRKLAVRAFVAAEGGYRVSSSSHRGASLMAASKETSAGFLRAVQVLLT